MLEGTEKNTYSNSLVGKRLNQEIGSVVTRIRLRSCLPNGKVNKYDRNDRENKDNQSGFKCLIVNTDKKRPQLGPSWRQERQNKVSIF